MIPIVNDKYKYILLYSAKAACTSLRKLYLEIHGDELSEEQQSQLRAYHNINELHRYDITKDYSDYTTFAISRNPYARVISAFLDQYVYALNPRVQDMMDKHPPTAVPNTFLEFLRYLAQVPDKDRDTHFQTQAFLPFSLTVVTRRCLRYWIPRKPENRPFKVNYDGDISGYKTHLQWLFQRVFKHDAAKREQAITALLNQQKTNALFYSDNDYPDAANMTVAELDSLVFSPKPQDFLNQAEVVALIQKIYARDFKIFAYALDDYPAKKASEERAELPDDFDWQMYQRLNPDLPEEFMYNERSFVRHYLEYGRFEGAHRGWKFEAPAGFDWQVYLELHDDLKAAGIESEEGALEHYLSYGQREGRAYTKEQ